MAVTIHAAVLLAIPVIAVVACVVGPRRPPSERNPRRATAFVVGAALMVLCLTVKSVPGLPLSQCGVVGAGMWLILVYLGTGRIRLGLTVLMVASMLALSWQYVHLVQSREWVGDVPLKLNARECVNRSCLLSVQRLLKQSALEEDEEIYPAGWVHDMPFASKVDDWLYDDLVRIEIGNEWHSCFSRLFPYREVRQSYWFPGGSIADAADSVVLKDLPWGVGGETEQKSNANPTRRLSWP